MNSLKINGGVCLLVLCLSVAVDQSSGGAIKWPSDYAGGVKTYLVNLAKAKVISNNEVLNSFNEALERVKVRYAEALENLSEEQRAADQSTLYYKLVIEEMRGLREKYEPVVAQQIAAAGDEQQLIGPEDELADESELINELDDAEKRAQESEMGIGLSPEKKAALKKRTLVLMQELLGTELRQLAIAMLTSYMTGSSMAPMVLALSSALKFRLVQYLMNVVMDMLQQSFGRPIQVEPLNEESIITPDQQLAEVRA